MKRFFTAEEANAALGEVRPLAERLVAHRHSLAAAQTRQAGVATQIAANGGDLSPQDVREAASEVERAVAGIADCLQRLDALGVQVKDIDVGLLDFPARRRSGEPVLLCWKVGEPEVAYWHGEDEGFAGRRPLPLD